MVDQGPWGHRDGSGAQAPATPPRARRRYGGPGNMPEPRTRGRLVLVLSSLLMVGFLWLLSGSWVIAWAIMLGLFVHEYGHAVAMNRLGMGPARVYIIPFLGGLAKGAREPKSEWIGVLVSLAGPAFGLLAMVPLVIVALATGSKEWMLAAFFVAMLNLVNLAPAPPLDGSRALGPVLARVHPALEKLALLLVGITVVVWGLMTGRYILAVFLGLAIFGHLQKGGLRAHEGPLSWKEAGRSLGLFGLTAVLCGGAAVASLLAVTDGDAVAAVDLVGGYLGIGHR